MLARRTKGIIAAVGVLAAVATAWTWHDEPPQPTGATLLAFAGLCILFLVAERTSVPLTWRGQRITASFTEPVVLAGLFWLPGTPLVLAAALARLTSAVIERRPPPKAFYNMAQIALAANIALLVFRVAPVTPLLAAVLGTITYTVVLDGATVVVVGSVEPGSWRRALHERFLGVAVAEIVFGLSIGLAIVGLAMVHVLAPLVLAPLLWVLLRHARLQAKMTRESGLHRRLAREQRRLIGIQDDHLIGEAILDACHDILQVGRARLTLVPDIAWTRTWDSLPEDAPPDTGVTLMSIEGRVDGRLDVWRRPGKPRLGKEEEALLLQLAAQTETALANAKTLREATAQRAILARQERLSTLGTLIAGVAHEVNNPLTYLRGNLELALMDVGDLKEGIVEEPQERLPEIERQITTALQGASRIGDIVQSLRAVARQRPSSEREQVHLNKLAQDVANVLSAGLPKNITLDVERAPGDPFLLAHPTDLHQVLLNLAKNGIEAMGDSTGKMTLRVRVDPEAYHIDVQDTGPGIPADVRAKLFTPFFTTKGTHGTGLGLAIVHGILKDLGGSIHLDTEVGRGTTFSVALPRSR